MQRNLYKGVSVGSSITIYATSIEFSRHSLVLVLYVIDLGDTILIFRFTGAIDLIFLKKEKKILLIKYTKFVVKISLSFNFYSK